MHWAQLFTSLLISSEQKLLACVSGHSCTHASHYSCSLRCSLVGVTPSVLPGTLIDIPKFKIGYGPLPRLISTLPRPSFFEHFHHFLNFFVVHTGEIRKALCLGREVSCNITPCTLVKHSVT